MDLGRFYDLPAAKAQVVEVKRHTRDYQDAYGRAYRCLKAARQVELDTVAEVSRVFDRQRAARRFSGIMARELRGRGSGTGKITRRFLGSLTHRGPVWRFDSVETLCPKVYELEDSYEQAGPLLAALTGEPLPAREDIAAKKQLLLRHGLALWDTLESCTITGASDASIRDVVPNDIAGLLRKAPIRAVFCNGATAYRIYTKYQQPLTGIPAVRLPSTSPANAACSPARLEELWGAALADWIVK